MRNTDQPAPPGGLSYSTSITMGVDGTMKGVGHE
jgi:hypothetical protein